MQFEHRNECYDKLEALFSESLHAFGSVRMWRFYLQYVRSCNAAAGEDASPPPPLPPHLSAAGQDGGAAEERDVGQREAQRRATVTRAFELAISNVGLDYDSFPIHKDYIDYLGGAPTRTLYEEQVQMDAIRRAYQKALATPIEGLERLWHDYDAYENGLNKVTAKKILADRSPAYMAARAAGRELAAIMAATSADEYPIDPRATEERAAGGGEEERDAVAKEGGARCVRYMRWIRWEKTNPLAFPSTAGLLQQRISYAYKRSLLVLRLYPEVWFDYSRFVMSSGAPLTAAKLEECEAVLGEALACLPCDLLVNLAYCDFLEGTPSEEAGDGPDERTLRAKALYEGLLAALTERIGALSAALGEASDDRALGRGGEEDTAASAPTIDEQGLAATATAAAAGGGNVLESRPVLVYKRDALTRDLTLTYTQYMNFARRTEGINGARAVFTRARKSPHVTYHVFVAAARMEMVCKKEPVVAGKIYELGMARFADDVRYVLEYLGHLIALDDDQNARALFERSILTVAQPLNIWTAYLDYLFKYGETATIRALARRFQEAFPGSPVATEAMLFSRQHAQDDLCPVGERIWTSLQDWTASPSSPPAALGAPPTTQLPTPFCVDQTIWDLCSRLPDAYDGPEISCDGVVRLLQIVRLGALSTQLASQPQPLASFNGRHLRPNGDRPARPLGGHQPAPGRRPLAPSSGKRRRDYPGDGPGALQPVHVPIREDDIFAHRHLERTSSGNAQ